MRSSMKHPTLFLLLSCVSMAAGCSICSPGYINHYGASGGKWQRVDAERGRVGSVLSGGSLDGPPAGTYETVEGEYYDWGGIESETLDTDDYDTAPPSYLEPNGTRLQSIVE